jgi:hypothetical protein
VTQRDICPIKDDGILVAPNRPTSNHNSFSEDSRVELSSSFNLHVLRWQGCILLNVDEIPTTFTKETFKKEMKQVFFSVAIAHDTIIIRKLHILSLEVPLCLDDHGEAARKRIYASPLSMISTSI